MFANVNNTSSSTVTTTNETITQNQVAAQGGDGTTIVAGAGATVNTLDGTMVEEAFGTIERVVEEAFASNRALTSGMQASTSAAVDALANTRAPDTSANKSMVWIVAAIGAAVLGLFLLKR